MELCHPFSLFLYTAYFLSSASNRPEVTVPESESDKTA